MPTLTAARSRRTFAAGTPGTWCASSGRHSRWSRAGRRRASRSRWRARASTVRRSPRREGTEPPADEGRVLRGGRPRRLRRMAAGGRRRHGGRRRAGGGAAGSSARRDASATSGHSLRAHLDRVVTRLTDLSGPGALPPELEAAIERAIDGLGEREASRSLRGEARAPFVRLHARDRRWAASRPRGRLTPAGRARSACATRRRAGVVAVRARMARRRLRPRRRGCAEKLLRERWKLPDIRYECAVGVRQ